MVTLTSTEQSLLTKRTLTVIFVKVMMIMDPAVHARRYPVLILNPLVRADMPQK